MARRPKGTHEFPLDKYDNAGAVVITEDGQSFYVPTVLHGSDGKTAISANNPLAIASLAMSEPFEGATSMTKTFSKPQFGFVLKNKHTAALSFTLSDGTNTFGPITVDAGEPFAEDTQPYTQVTITATGPFKAYGLLHPNLDAIAPVPDTTAPNEVRNLTATNITDVGVTLNWLTSTSSDIEKYNIYSGTTFLTSVTGTTHSIGGLTPSTAYKLTVKAQDNAGNVSVGVFIDVNTLAASTPADTTAPGNAANLSAGTPTASGANLTWDAATDNVAVTGYQVFNGSTLVATITTLNYSLVGLSPSTQYTVTIKARDAAGNVSSGVSVTFTTAAAPDTTAPILTITPAAGTYSAAQNVSMSATDTGTVTIYYTTDGSEPDTNSPVYSNPFSVSATVKAFAQDAAGNRSTTQTVVYTISIATIPAVPTGLTATAGNAKVDLAWNAVTGATSYKVYRDGTLLASPTTASYSDATAVNGTAYSYTVSAINSAGESAQSAAASATPVASAQTVIFSDNFDRVDAASLANGWTSGGLQIIGNQAGSATSLTAASAWETRDTTYSDNIEISLDVFLDGTAFVSLLTGIVFRYSSSSIMYAFGFSSNTSLRVRSSGGSTAPADKTGLTFAAGIHTLKVKLMGQTVECYHNGVLEFTFTDALLTANTKHGMGLYSQTMPKFNDFSVKTI